MLSKQLLGAKFNTCSKNLNSQLEDALLSKLVLGMNSMIRHACFSPQLSVDERMSLPANICQTNAFITLDRMSAVAVPASFQLASSTLQLLRHLLHHPQNCNMVRSGLFCLGDAFCIPSVIPENDWFSRGGSHSTRTINAWENAQPLRDC